MTQACPRCGNEIPKPVDNCTHCGKAIESGRTERENPSRVEGCLSLFVPAVILPSTIVSLLGLIS